MNAVNPKIVMVALDDLTLSPDNPRQVVSAEYIAALAGSLAEVGLIQSLAGVETDTGIQIVAGGCRLRALNIAVLMRPDLAQVPVVIAPDAATAKVWSAVENDLRRALKPGAMIRAARNARARGDDVTTIARVFGTTDAEVRRSLALADLPDNVVAALDDERLSWDQAKALAIAPSPERLAEGLAAALDGNGAHVIRRMYQGPISQRDRRVRLVGIDALEAAGATIHRDLFNDDLTVTGEDICDRLFAEKVTQMEAEEMSDGWKWVKTDLTASSTWDVKSTYLELEEDEIHITEAEIAELDELDEIRSFERTREQDDRHTELSAMADGTHSLERRRLSGTILFFDHSGLPKMMRGLLGKDDIEAAVDAGMIEQPKVSPGPNKTQDDDAPAPALLSAALKADLDNLRGLAIGLAISKNPELALYLHTFQMSGHTRYHAIFAEGYETSAIIPDVDGLTIDGDFTRRPASMDRAEPTEKTLKAFIKKGPEARNKELAIRLGARVKSQPGGPQMVAAIEKLAGSSIRDVWIPTASNFFKRVNAGYLQTIYNELLVPTGDSEKQAEFAKFKKGEQDQFMAEVFEGGKDELMKIDITTRARIDNWTPGLDS